MDFFPDTTGDPNEEGQAQKRALSIGLLSTGLNILAQPHYKGGNSIQPIARGAAAGLDSYSESLQESAKAMMEKQKMYLDAEKERVADERATAWEKHQTALEDEATKKEQQQATIESERARHDSATETIQGQRADVAQQQADTASKRADTAAAAESRRFDPVGATSPMVQRFDRYRNVPGLEKYMAVNNPPEELATLSQPDLMKREAEIRKEYLNVQKGKVNTFNGADGMRHQVTTDAAGVTQDIILGAVPTPGTDKDAKTKDFTEYKAEADGSKTPWTVTRNMSIPGNPVINVQPVKGHSYGWIYKDPDRIPKASDFPGLDPAVTGRIGSKPGTTTAGPSAAAPATTKSGKAVVYDASGTPTMIGGMPVAIDPATKKLHYVKTPTVTAAGGSSGGGGGGPAAGGAPRAPAAPGGKPVLYTPSGKPEDAYRNKTTGEYLVKMPDGSWGWAKSPNGDGARPAGAAGAI